MKLVSYRSRDSIRHGVLSGAPGAESIADLGAGDLLALLTAGPDALARALERIGPTQACADVQLVAPLLRPPKVLGLAQNYPLNVPANDAPVVDKARRVPRLFLKPSSAIIGPNEPLRLPRLSHEVDGEVELAPVIGARCRNVPIDHALDVVAGYTIANDVSAISMDWGIERDANRWNEMSDWLVGKWLDGFAPLGPYLVTADEVPDPQALELTLTVSGEVKQRASTGQMIYGVAEIIAFLSSIMTLEPGDVILTGTPDAVSATTTPCLQAGQVMEASIERLGTLRTPVWSSYSRV